MRTPLTSYLYPRGVGTLYPIARITHTDFGWREEYLNQFGQVIFVKDIRTTVEETPKPLPE
jgi:hypothetical protein